MPVSWRRASSTAGGVAAPPTEPGTDRDLFFQMNAEASGERELLREQPGGLGREIVGGIGEGGIGAGEFDTGGDEVEVERIAEGDRHHEGFEFVESVGATPENVEIEIDLGGSELFHWPQLTRRCR